MAGNRTVAYNKGTTGAQHSFAQVPSANIQRSVFNRSCGHKTTFDAGYLVPIFVDEVLPGDTMRMRMSSLCRLLTPLKPIMDNLFMDFFFFFVPNRLVWENWQRFCGEEPNPGDSIDFEVPIMAEAVATGSLSDYFGLPLSATAYDHSSLFHRGYAKVWNDWFRDQNLQDAAQVVDPAFPDGPDDPADYPMRRRGKRHDYFSSSLPFVQKGPDVSFLLGSSAPVVSSGTGVPTFNVGTVTNTPLENRASVSETHWNAAAGIPVTSASWNTPSLQANLSGATAATINALREAVVVQQFLEKSARGGTRYVEIIKSMFGVDSEDQRLQRPEYLGGGTTRVNIHPVAATNQVTGTLTLTGVLGAYGTQAADGIGFNKSFTEHGMIIGLANVRADITYQQGLDRMFSRSTRFDFYWPQFANLGEQSVLNREIFLQDTAADLDVFGYQERWAEYRYKPSRTSGLMRSGAVGTLNVWHLGLQFTALPLLNDVFIQDDPPLDRVVAVPAEPHFLADFFFDYKCARPMPLFSVPGLDRL